MSLVDDILTMNSAESRCYINGDTRDIVVPDEYHIFGVESDENVTRIPFICPKIVGDNVDLTGYSLYINYINGAGLGGIYVVDDVVTNGDNITFSWLLSRNVTAKAGTVSYIICAKKSGTDTKVTNEWNTKIATGTVSSGIETYDTVAQQSSDVINKLLNLTQGQSAYDIAIDNGFVGTKAAWLESLKGTDGKSAYQYAQDGGYTGTEEEFVAKLTSEALIVHVAESNGTLSADKTYVDIRDAILDGTPVLVDYGGVRFPLISMGNSLFFGASQCNETSVVTVIIEIASNDEVHDFSAQITIPTTLPNPNALTFTGAVTGSYDGSAPMSVEIPSGGGSGSDISLGLTGATVGQIAKITAVDASGVPTAWEAVDIPSGVQSDWNQNDGTQQDYVKNRPFYTGGPVETTFVEDSTVSFTRNEYSGFYLGSLQSTFVATVGETYKVSWDGTTYECTSADSNGKTIIGNLSMMGAGSDTGEPFIMMVQNRVGIEIATADTSASHTFSIGGFIPEIVKIDRKYLPKAAFITYDSSNSTYISDLANDELYETLLNGQQVVCLGSNKCKYLTEWTKKLDGRIELIFSGGLELSLYPDGTISEPSPE